MHSNMRVLANHLSMVLPDPPILQMHKTSHWEFSSKSFPTSCYKLKHCQNLQYGLEQTIPYGRSTFHLHSSCVFHDFSVIPWLCNLLVNSASCFEILWVCEMTLRSFHNSLTLVCILIFRKKIRSTFNGITCEECCNKIFQLKSSKDNLWNNFNKIMVFISCISICVLQ